MVGKSHKIFGLFFRWPQNDLMQRTYKLFEAKTPWRWISSPLPSHKLTTKRWHERWKNPRVWGEIPNLKLMDLPKIWHFNWWNGMDFPRWHETSNLKFLALLLAFCGNVPKMLGISMVEMMVSTYMSKKFQEVRGFESNHHSNCLKTQISGAISRKWP